MKKSLIRNLEIEERVLNSGNYIIETKDTIRGTAKFVGVSKSTTHKDLTKRLPEIDMSTYLKVKEIINDNYNERAIRGGEATKKKYLRK